MILQVIELKQITQCTVITKHKVHYCYINLLLSCGPLPYQNLLLSCGPLPYQVYIIVLATSNFNVTKLVQPTKRLSASVTEPSPLTLAGTRSLPPEEKLSSSRVDGNASPEPAEEKARKNPTLAEKQEPSWRG